MHYEVEKIQTEPRRVAALLRAYPDNPTVREFAAALLESLTDFLEATAETVSKEQYAAILERDKLRRQDRRKPDSTAVN